MSANATPLTLLVAAAATGRRAVRRHRTRILTVLVTLTMVAATLLGSFDPARPVDGGAQASHLPDDVCAGAPHTHYYDVVAVQVDIVYNRWGDHDPDGRLFVLEENKQALLDQIAADPDEPAPLAQPFVVRAHLDDCVVFNLTNELAEDVSLHVHGVVAQPGQGMDLGTNGADLTAPGETRTYKVRVPRGAAAEGAHMLHSHASTRFQTRHGLFGALVAEPPGTGWLAQDGTPTNSGQEVIITDPDGADFREYIILYHDEIVLLDKDDDELPIVSPFGEYGPGTKGMNMRTEPFMDRFEFHDDLFDDGVLPRGHDKSQGYGSYTYGDPATFFAEAYVGDPTKMRLMNVGPGQHHVHHLHGGGIRWRNSPVSDDTQFDDGFVKVNPVNRSASERIDVQSLGPGEAFNAVIEGGAGGVQQTVGDLLIHCHVVEHYVAGMWMFWRVYNTEQEGLAELPDRDPDAVQAAKDSVELYQQYQLEGQLPDGRLPTEDNFRDWVEAQLPPQGVPRDNDASVWDWEVEDTLDGPLYLGEPESGIDFPNFPLDDPDHLDPGERPELLFDPTNGRLAYPHLRPHFGERPPFAPGHGGAPYLGDDVTDTRPDGLCPPGARNLDYNVVAADAEVAYNDKDADPDGMIFVLAEDKAAAQSDPTKAKSLVVRGNQGDCIDVVLTSELNEDLQKKVNMHIHLVQFDIQASDGVITGFNYEQSVRSAETTGTALDQDADAGADKVKVVDDSTIPVGTDIGIGLTEDNLEVRTVVGKSGAFLNLDAPLNNDHFTGERVGHEFVRYRWHPDVELGMVYWHDHVNGLISWRHGLFGGLVVEPMDSQWCDPRRDATQQTDCGDRPTDHVVDVVSSNPDNRTDRTRTYREYVVQVQDRSLPDDLASFNLRAAPLDDRDNTANPLNSSAEHGDPATDLWEAYPGDPAVIRLLYAGQSTSRAVATFGVTGHRFPLEQHNPGSRLIDALSLGISSQHNLRLEEPCGAGGCYQQAGDYMYHLTQPDNLRRGGWGVFRVYEPADPDASGLVELPSNADPAEGSVPTGPIRPFNLTAIRANVVLNERENLAEKLWMFVPSDDVDAVRDGTLRPEPLVLRAVAGETVEVTLTNDLGEPVTFHAGFLQADPTTDGGVPVGDNPLGNIQLEDGETRTFRWFADKPGTGYITSFGVPASQSLKGLYGAIVVEPAGTAIATGEDVGASATVTLSNGTEVREHVLVYQTNDPKFQSSIMPYHHVPDEHTLVNYRTEPFEDRLDDNLEPDVPTDPHVLNSSRFGAPETPVVDVQEGQPLRIVAVGGGTDQLMVHHVQGHWWAKSPDLAGSNVVDFVTLGEREISDAWVWEAGPGGPGDYLYATHRAPFLEIGGWGLVRVG